MSLQFRTGYGSNWLEVLKTNKAMKNNTRGQALNHQFPNAGKSLLQESLLISLLLSYLLMFQKKRRNDRLYLQEYFKVVKIKTVHEND